MIRNVECKFYYITSSLDQVKIKNIKKFRDIGVIYKQENDKSVDILNCYNLKNICKKYHIPFFVCDDFKLATKLNTNGVFILAVLILAAGTVKAKLRVSNILSKNTL